ncbi:MAG TPA: hypothetical protein PKG74_02805, partial [Candidatus Colwellbacteria bacterium]|nr:hypothetical protein [Candidatus Colwellbacteria bacterium]
MTKPLVRPWQARPFRRLSIPLNNPLLLTSLDKQAKALRKIFPELKDATFDRELAKRIAKWSREVGVGGLFLLPRWELIAAKYNEALLQTWVGAKMAGWSSSSYLGDPEKFCEAVEERFLRQGRFKEGFIRDLAEIQPDSGLLVLPVQPVTPECLAGGMRRELRSRQGVPLGLFEVLCVIVSQWPDVSYLQCPHMITTSGDLYAKNGDGKFRYAEDSDNMVYIGGLHP